MTCSAEQASAVREDGRKRSRQRPAMVADVAVIRANHEDFGCGFFAAIGDRYFAGSSRNEAIENAKRYARDVMQAREIRIAL